MKVSVNFTIEHKDWETEIELKDALNEIANIFGFTVTGIKPVGKEDTELDKEDTGADLKSREAGIQEAVDICSILLENSFENTNLLPLDLIAILRSLPDNEIAEVIRRVKIMYPEAELDCYV